MMIENFRKTFIYFKKWNTYWNLTNKIDKLAIDPGPLERYPLDFKPRIEEGHYPHFDENGIPMWHKKNGIGYIYHYTTMFSYALGQSDRYLLSGKPEYLNILVAVAEYILKTAIKEGNDLLLKETDEDGNHTGNLSAMTHGEAISVLCRTAEYTSDKKFLEAANNLISPFERSIENKGIVGIISSVSSPWYEEYIDKPVNHVLNGMVYSLWGLRDLSLADKNEKAKDLFLEGAGYIERALPLFDSGYWSYYWIPESGKKYTASMMYHNLHICQLQALFEQTGKQVFKIYADKFLSYAKSPLCRLKAAKDITLAKTGA